MTYRTIFAAFILATTFACAANIPNAEAGPSTATEKCLLKSQAASDSTFFDGKNAYFTEDTVQTIAASGFVVLEKGSTQRIYKAAVLRGQGATSYSAIIYLGDEVPANKLPLP